MPIFIRDGKSVLFIHIPKTGGSTIETMFREAGWERHLYEAADPKDINLVNHYLSVPPQHMHRELLTSLVRLERLDAIFTVVRHPFARLKSEYHWQSRYFKGSIVQPEPDQWWRESLEVLKNSGPESFQNHLRHQVDFLLEGAHVYRYEDGLERVAADFNLLVRLGGLWEKPMPRKNQSQAGSSELSFSAESIRDIENFYSADYSTFGYSKTD